MLLASCSYKSSDEPSRRDDSEEIPISPDDIFDELDLGPAVALEDNSYFHSNHKSDVAPDYKVIIGIDKSANDLLLRSKLVYSPSEMVSIVDNGGKEF